MRVLVDKSRLLLVYQKNGIVSLLCILKLTVQPRGKRALKGDLSWYGKLTWESTHAWNLIILSSVIVWGMTFIFMVHLSFYAIPLLIYDVMYDITYPVIINFKVNDICNGRRNVLLNNFTIDKFVDTINGFVCIRIASGHSFL